jgi:hypothetical protein
MNLSEMCNFIYWRYSKALYVRTPKSIRSNEGKLYDVKPLPMTRQKQSAASTKDTKQFVTDVGGVFASLLAICQ